MTDEKWRSPTRHSIANHITDKLPPKGEARDDVSEALDWVTHRIGEITLAKVLCCNLEPDNSAYQKELDNLDMVKRALAQQQAVNEELLEALKSIVKSEWVKNEKLSIEAGQYMFTTDARTIAKQAIARAEQKGQNHE